MEFEPLGVERTPLMGDENDAFEFMGFDKKAKIIDDAVVCKLRFGTVCEANGPARERDAIIAGEIEAVREKIVEVFADPAVAAINGGRVNALGFVWN
jgi:hypothetical protein